MIVIRDVDTAQERASEVLERLSLRPGSVGVLSEQTDPLSEIRDDCVLFITTMPAGCLGYHRKFFDAHRSGIPLWAVLLLNGDPVAFNQADAFFYSDGIRRQLFAVAGDMDWAALSGAVKKLTSIRPRMALLYSVRPHCGKRSLIRLLSEDLPDWEFETAEEDSRGIPDTSAGQLLIVGQNLTDLCAVRLPAGVEPFYVLTMPDMHVQAYLHAAQLPGRLLEYDGPPAHWTEAAAKRRLFYISPLYESWYRTNTNPVYDERFVMWDRFGLPYTESGYTEKAVRVFLSQFRQGEQLSEALRNTLCG